MAVAAEKGHIVRKRSKNVFRRDTALRSGQKTLPTFDVLAEDWLVDLKTRVKESTSRYYAYIWAHYLAPCLKDKRPDGVTKDTAEEIIRYHENLSDVTARNIVAVLRSLLRYSETACGYSLPNQTLQISPKRTEKQSLSEEPWQKLRACLSEEGNVVAVSIAMASLMGLRTGEICALRKEDVDLDQGILHVRHTVQRVGGGTGQTEVQIGTPKSELSNRVVPIPDRLLPKLKKLCEKRKAEDFLFGKNGKLMEPRTLQYRCRRFLAKHGLPNISFQQLRRNFAIQNIKQNADVRTLGEIMGDGSIGLIAQRYEETDMEKKRAQMNRFAAAL